MKTLIWKEFRENRLWLALISWISVVSMAGVIFGWTDYNYYSSPRPNNFRFDGLLTVAFLTMPAAFLMGIAQTIFEVRRDQWAYLTQRPVTKTQIFLSKTIVGLGICLVVAILPTLMMVAWSWRADHISFDLTDVLIVWSPFFASITFYFTAMLIVCGSSRWYISRLFACVWPVLAFFVWLIYLSELNLGLTWPIFIWLMFSACVLGFAAWGAFTGKEGSKPMRRAARISWASVLFVAFQAGLVIVYGFSLSGYEEYDKVSRRHHRIISRTGTDYHIDKQGHVIQIDYRIDLDFSQTSDNRRQVYTTMVTDLDDPASVKYKHLEGQVTGSLYVGGPNSPYLPLSGFWMAPQQSRQLRRNPFVEGARIVHEQQQAQWVYSKSRGLFYLFLTDRQDDEGNRLPAKLKALIGPDGFTSPNESLPQKRFGQLLPSGNLKLAYGRNRWDVDGDQNSNTKINKRLFHFEDGIYAIDYGEKKVERIYTAPVGKRVCSVTSMPESQNMYVLFEDEIHTHEPSQIALGTKANAVDKNKPIVQNFPGKFLKKISIPPNVAALRQFSLGEVEETGEMVFVGRGGPSDGLTADLTRIVKVAANGEVTSSREFVASPPVLRTEEKVITSLVAGMTPVAAVIATASVDGVYQSSTGTGPGIIVRQLTHYPKFWAMPVAIMSGVGLVFAFIAYRRARRRNLSKKQELCWAAIGFFFGPAGLLTLTCMNRIAVRVTCSNCGSATAVDELNCSSCGSQAVVAPSRGIEIYDPKLTQAV